MSYREEIEPFLKKNPYQVMKVGGGNIRYVFAGESDKPVIIFLNGGMNCSEMWFKYVEKMSDEYRTLIFDYPIEIKSADETAEVIHEFFVKLGISSAFFAGASFGGMMAQIFTRKYPEMVNGLGLFSTAGLDENTMRTEKKKYRFLPILLWYMKHSNYEKLKPKVIQTCIKNYAKDETPEDRKYLREMLEYMFKDYPKEKDIHITGMVGKVVNLKPCIMSDFDRVQDKVLLIFPEKDFFSNEEQQSLKNLFPKARVEYIKNGHYGTVLEYDKYIGWMRKLFQDACVLPDCRRMGIGKKLVDLSLEALKKQGINKVLLVAFKKNVGGNAFWESQGFTLREDLNYRNKALVEMIRIDPDYLK